MMLSVSSNFKTAMAQPIKSIEVNLSYYNNSDEEIYMTGEDAIISVKLSCDGELGSSAMKKIEVSLLKSALPSDFSDIGINDIVYLDYLVYTSGDVWETAVIGEFVVTEFKNTDDDETCSITAYDRIYDTMVKYAEKQPLYIFWEEPATLLEYITDVLDKCNITLGNTDWVQNDLVINEDRYNNIYGFTVRDFINDICKISGTIAIMSPYKVSSDPELWEDRLFFKAITSSVYSIDVSNLITHKVKTRYGNINKVIFAREPQGDYGNPLADSTSINTYGLTEWKVDNNQLVDYQPIIDPSNPVATMPKDYRDDNITNTFNAVNGIYYYPFTAETIGYGWWEIGDRIKIGDNYTIILGYNINFDGGIKETISARDTNKTDTKTKFVNNKNQNQTQLVVDKQNQIIRSYVEKTDENTSSILALSQTSTQLAIAITQTGGYNILQNSVMYNYEIVNGIYIPKIWESEGTGTLTISYIGDNSDSGNEFTLSGANGTSGKIESQTVTLTPDTDTTTNKTYYSLAFKLKKSIGTAWARIKYSEDQYVYASGITSDAITEYTQFSIEDFLPTEPVNIVEFFGSANSESSFTDVRLKATNKVSSWELANGEITNESVIIDKSGILVQGQDKKYSTVISPVEFTGKYNGETVFTLNGDVTEVNYLSAQNEIILPPLRIHAYTDGWGIIKS